MNMRKISYGRLRVGKNSFAVWGVEVEQGKVDYGGRVSIQYPCSRNLQEGEAWHEERGRMSG
jgi:hypothetical protein